MDTASDAQQLAPILKAVSRSFYLSMVFLPREMRPAVSLAYLLARASDSVADSSSAQAADRLRILRSMAHVCSDAPRDPEIERALFKELAQSMAVAQDNPKEAELLRHYGECLDIMRRLPQEQQKHIEYVLASIHEGQIWDIEYFQEHSHVTSEEDSLRYCYQVAGCVGEFWTNIGYCTMSKYSSHPQRGDLIEAGIRYGQGLQLVNILRDEIEDAERGRHYLSGERAEWMRRARHYLIDGIAYSKTLSSFKLRFTALLPALLGLKTLKKMEQSDAQGDATTQKVKITRGSVYRSMLKALFTAW